jgi:HlyD family secretion protein
LVKNITKNDIFYRYGKIVHQDEVKMEENQLNIKKKSLFKKKFSKKTLWIIIGAVVIILIVVVASSMNKAKQASAQVYQTEPIVKGDLVAIVGATGTVRANQSAILSWQTTGRIEKINYQVGDSVSSGDVLSSLASTSLPQTVILAASDLVTAQQSLDDLKNSRSSLSTAELNLANAQSAYNTALGNYWQRNQTQGSANQITVYEAKLQIQDNHIDDLKNLYDNMTELPDNDTKKAQTLQNLTQAHIDRDSIKKLLDYYRALPSSLDVQTLESKLDVAKANLDTAQKAYNDVKTGVNANDLAAAQAKVDAAKATVAMGTLTAPFSGQITESDSMVGDFVIIGTTSFRMDDLSKLIVDVEIPEVDINSIKVGQPVTLTFDAITGQEYSGKVVEVTRVGDSINNVVNFKVSVQILNPDDKVLPGMTTAVNITVTQLKDVLIVPNRSVRTVNNELTIYLLRNGVAVKVPIVLGASSDTSSEIASGDVKEGDQVILNPPSSLVNLMQSQGSQSRPGAN